MNRRTTTAPSAAPLIDVRFAARRPWVPPAGALRQWAALALAGRCPVPAAVSIRIVGAGASRALNARFRGKDRPTNVLSFEGPGLGPDGIRRLGDLVICAPVLERERREQKKSRQAHWAHITLHGVLHLLGFDHVDSRGAVKMEATEVQILESMGFSNPYL